MPAIVSSPGLFLDGTAGERRSELTYRFPPLQYNGRMHSHLAPPHLGSPIYSQDMYAGYINVNVSHGRNLFYWLVESAGSPATDPLVLWTNGAARLQRRALRRYSSPLLSPFPLKVDLAAVASAAG